ncbi:uncharacterized protein ATC70_013290 [Mucor velutinosus]|uniref:Uncharacterized protein n=1 Tax=Mucor velutinosus TaxID=708070 RepID=A0AAN7HYG2_9FUNG|nr:hypothetical protein ATC70_013290 [Mucor velutinosus]
MEYRKLLRDYQLGKFEEKAAGVQASQPVPFASTRLLTDESDAGNATNAANVHIDDRFTEVAYSEGR